jgi:hypothetical protein
VPEALERHVSGDPDTISRLETIIVSLCGVMMVALKKEDGPKLPTRPARLRALPDWRNPQNEPNSDSSKARRHDTVEVGKLLMLWEAVLAVRTGDSAPPGGR